MRQELGDSDKELRRIPQNKVPMVLAIFPSIHFAAILIKYAARDRRSPFCRRSPKIQRRSQFLTRFLYRDQGVRPSLPKAFQISKDPHDLRLESFPRCPRILNPPRWDIGTEFDKTSNYRT